MGQLKPVDDLENIRKKPTLVLTRDEINEIYSLFTNGIIDGDKKILPDGIAFFLTKDEEEQIIIDFVSIDYENGDYIPTYIGIGGGGGEPPRLPLKV